MKYLFFLPLVVGLLFLFINPTGGQESVIGNPTATDYFPIIDEGYSRKKTAWIMFAIATLIFLFPLWVYLD